jgi:hypothetical protein
MPSNGRGKPSPYERAGFLKNRYRVAVRRRDISSPFSNLAQAY